MKIVYRSLSNRKLFLCLTAISIAFLVGGAVSGQPPSGGRSTEQQGQIAGVTKVGERGIEKTTAEIIAAGLAPSNTLEAAIAATLPPGLYTALLAGLNNGTGVGLVEVYDRGSGP